MTSSSFSTLSLPPQQLQNLSDLGYKVMTDIQAAALPPAMAGIDLIAQAKTGSGKTAAFSIPLLNKLNPLDFTTQAIVLCPTRELATQVAGEIRRLARYQQNVKVIVLCGGQPIGPQIGSLEHGAHIVVGTPGRIMDHLRKETLSLASINTVVLDEADRMLDMGFADDIASIVDVTPTSRQTLLFSATYPDDIERLSRQFQKSPQQIRVDKTVESAKIVQRFFICAGSEKMAGLEKMLHHFHPDAAVVFCHTKERTREVHTALNAAGIEALALHGDLEQRERDQVLIQFRQRSCRILVATDVAARGLDIDGLPAVINFDVPRDVDTYVHRIGRTGRADKTGLALSLLADNERYKMEAISQYQNSEPSLDVLSDLSGTSHTLAAPEYVTLAIAGGRKDKVRPGDILGALTGSAGIDSGAVGRIDVVDHAAFVAVERETAARALNGLANGKIKGRKFKVRQLKGQPKAKKRRDRR